MPKAYTTTTSSPPPGGGHPTEKTTEEHALGLPMLPSYAFRYGLSDRVDFGVGMKNLYSLQGDLKLNFVRGRLDMALDPGVQYGLFVGRDGTIHALHVHVPPLVGVNLGESVSLVAAAGGTGSLPFGVAHDRAPQGRGVFARLGFAPARPSRSSRRSPG